MHLRNQKSLGHSAVEKHFRFKNEGCKKKNEAHQGLRLKSEEKCGMSVDKFVDCDMGKKIPKRDTQFLLERNSLFLHSPSTLPLLSFFIHTPCHLLSPEDH